MIARLTGIVEEVRDCRVLLAVGDVSYEVSVPASTAIRLAAKGSERVTLHTLQQFEGNVAIGNLTPRLYGFLPGPDRELALLLTRVKGISLRRAMKLMEAPAVEIAEAIQRNDVRYLSSLPEIGKKTAAEIVNVLRESMGALVASHPSGRPAPPELTRSQRIALEILVQWGDRPAEAQQWISAAVQEDSSLQEPDAIVRAAYRIKGGKH